MLYVCVCVCVPCVVKCSGTRRLLVLLVICHANKRTHTFLPLHPSRTCLFFPPRLSQGDIFLEVVESADKAEKDPKKAVEKERKDKKNRESQFGGNTENRPTKTPGKTARSGKPAGGRGSRAGSRTARAGGAGGVSETPVAIMKSRNGLD